VWLIGDERHDLVKGRFELLYALVEVYARVRRHACWLIKK
jgi:hypothetical protein